MGHPSASVAFGVQVGLHPSWFVIFVVLAYAMAAGSLPRLYPGWDEALYWITGAAIAIFFFVSVLAHELSHAIVARRLGLRVKNITLFIFGGAATLEGDPKRPREEAVIAAAGPLEPAVGRAARVAASSASRSCSPRWDSPS
jgi:Zn-dependent protease